MAPATKGRPRSAFTEQHETFCRAYVRTWNAVRAAAAVGITPTAGRLLLQRKAIQDRIRELNDKLLKASDITAQRVMMEIARVAFSDIRGIVDESGRLKPLAELDTDTAAAIAGIEIETRMERDGVEIDLATGEAKPRFVSVQTAKVKRYDKNPALGLLVRHFKLVGDEGDGLNAIANALAARLQSARKRIEAQPVDGDPDHEESELQHIPRRLGE
jgi:phage terminase small subunit